MFDNFPIDPIFMARRRRRRFFVSGALFGLILGVVAASRAPGAELTEVSSAFRAISDAGGRFFSAGGDIEASKPKIVSPPPIPKQVGSSTPPSLSAASIIVKDQITGATVYGKDEYAEHSIASITKLMSALVLIEHSSFTESTNTAQVASDDIVDTHMYAGDTYTLADLWASMLVASSNKAVLTLVDAVWGNRNAFVERMNQKAIELGMQKTVFTDPTGLDDKNMSTASDVAILLAEALKHSEIRAALLTNEYELYSAERKKSHHFWNTDWLLLRWVPHSFASIHGGKTGYIPSAGYNFAVEIENEKGKPLDVVALGSSENETRFTDARDIAYWVYNNFVWPDSSSTPE